MKKRYKWLIGVMILTLATFSCKKNLLDVKPIDFVSDVAVFQDITLTSQFVNDIYGSLLSGFERRDFGWQDGWASGFALLDMMTDDIEGHNDLPMNKVHEGDLNPQFSIGTQMWAANYTLIRKANTLISRIDAVPTTNTALRDRLKAEGQFLRAFAYAELIKAFGGVPLITKEQSITDDLQVPRNTYDEIVDFIVKECDEAADVLPSIYPDATNLGRATKGAALALKARTLLHWASPLNNTTNDLTRWDAAAKAAQKVMDMSPSIYSLHPDYYQTFMTKAGNKEVIFAKKFARPSSTHQTAWMLHMSISPNPWGSWGAFHATQNLVDCFEMSNGKLPDESGSGYDEQNPYVNRDKRLDGAMLLNGSLFKGVTVQTYQSADLSVYPDGNANERTNGDRTKTGYGLRKFIDDRYLTSDAVYQGGDNDWIYMRYAEVLLNYAEAKNEFSGPDASVYDALDEVRGRGNNLPPLPRTYTQITLRDKIRNERRVELCFEEQRVYDVRRWKKGMTYFNGPIYRMNIVKNIDGSLTYNRRALLENRVYNERYNLFPIPQIERERNIKLTQNEY